MYHCIIIQKVQNLQKVNIGNLYIQKNIHTLISAFKLVRKKFPEVTLKLAGKAIDRSYLREIQDAIYSAKLEDAVEFLGEKEIALSIILIIA